ncbi:MAG: MoaD/ThiS family protein [Kosmotoga sp.]|uniref:MoaD/ThiS family protein n=1 Tax=Kosmotoga sp. TaxID=1955248 RepID=UPI0025C48D19|nr:MoaD/ThiS family protein [Kosmotoga sp.]MCD6160409.1 MoaD/ThiS family protein [Kosmotoga sp.]
MRVLVDKKEYNFSKSVSVKKLLENLNLNPESHIVLVDGIIKTPDSKIPENAEVRIVRAISGG